MPYISDLEYLAIPYSHKDEVVMDYRAEISDFICSELMKQGRIIYAPISSCHHIAKKYSLPRDWKFWKKMDEEFIRITRKLIVVMLNGWQNSVGVMAEIEIAKKFNIEIEFLDPIPFIEKLNEMKEKGKIK